MDLRRFNEARQLLQLGLSLIDKATDVSDNVLELKFVGLYNLGLAFEEDDCLEIALSYYHQCMTINSEDYELLY